MVKLILLLFTTLFLACNNSTDKGHSMVVLNNSEKKIDSIKITSYHTKIFFKDLGPGTAEESIFEVNKSLAGSGAFFCEVFIKDSLILATSFGYYSDINSINSTYTLTIDKEFRLRENK